MLDLGRDARAVPSTGPDRAATGSGGWRGGSRQVTEVGRQRKGRRLHFWVEFWIFDFFLPFVFFEHQLPHQLHNHTSHEKHKVPAQKLVLLAD